MGRTKTKGRPEADELAYATSRDEADVMVWRRILPVDERGKCRERRAEG